ncbi:c-type cytochrome [Tepidimonas aquatica]|uniref:Cytochrome subunit of sulfide dehydrogenase n=1 Tax=Tepidimonas aquatica TaxID=247482 RepID=A0A554WQB4_9BURK|nr:cytochrome c class I [Tepidimonas aquatica]TSE25779.1 Cytochrome subunit of sulfide dehydrogenase [Tepidimonas aquatica]
MSERKQPAWRRTLWPVLLAAGLTSVGVAVATVAQKTAASASAPTAPAAAAAAPSPLNVASDEPLRGDVMAHSCAACHGTYGQLGDEAFMPLAGMPVEQFVRTMKDFRDGKRPSTLMGHVARGFTDAQLLAMAEFFAAQKPL